MPVSVTGSTVAAVSKIAAAGGLRGAGFRRQGNHLHRTSGDLIHAVNFQSSRWGSADEGRFTINLVVTAPFLYTPWMGKPLPKNPATAVFPVQRRIGSMMPEHKDYWWLVNREVDAEVLGDEISTVLTQYAIPFFDRYPDSLRLLESVRAHRVLPGLTEGQVPLIHAMLAAHLGHTEEAVEQIRSSLDGATGGFRDNVLKLAERLSISP